MDDLYYKKSVELVSGLELFASSKHKSKLQRNNEIVIYM